MPTRQGSYSLTAWCPGPRSDLNPSGHSELCRAVSGWREGGLCLEAPELGGLAPWECRAGRPLRGGLMGASVDTTSMWRVLSLRTG